jgi:hypothetical protein
MLSKDIIKEQTLPHLSQGKRGAKCKAWVAFHLIAFCLLFLPRIIKLNKL